MLEKMDRLRKDQRNYPQNRWTTPKELTMITAIKPTER
jgi:hypothetical protein